MDFNQFDSVAAAEKGAELHVKDPATLEPLYDAEGKPCIVTLIGAESPSARAAARELQKAWAKAKEAKDTGGNDEKERISYDEIHDRLVQTLLPRVVGFKNISNGKKAATKEDAAWFFNLNRMNGVEGEKSFAEQAGEFSAKRSSYLGNASAG